VPALEAPEVDALPRNFMRALILLFVAAAPAHGYDLLERFRALDLAVDPGGLYRGLRAMEHSGLLHSTWEPSPTGPDRRRYELTERGKEQLDGWGMRLTRTSSLLALFLRHYGALSEGRVIDSEEGV
jgi:DNA-binding PadR family transcriptional regulator